MFDDKASKVQLVGIASIVVAVALVSLFGPKPEQNPTTQGVDDEEYLIRAMPLVLIWGLLGTLMLSFEILSNKWLMVRRNVPGNITGVFFMLIEGTLGTICLIIFTATGSGIKALESSSIGMLALSAVFNFSSLVIANYTIAKGIAGVAISIFNTNASLQCVLSSVFLKQIITAGQITGVVISVLGACTLGVGDMIIDKLTSK